MSIQQLFRLVEKFQPAPTVSAHCDGPCGVYDPVQARVSAEAVVSMTKKLLELEMPTDPNDADAMRHYLNTFTRYVAIKEQEAQAAKDHILILWTDYFNPEHVEKYPDLHDIVWQATKACSAAKQEISLEHAQEVLTYVEKIHGIFWATKSRDVKWVLASA